VGKNIIRCLKFISQIEPGLASELQCGADPPSPSGLAYLRICCVHLQPSHRHNFLSPLPPPTGAVSLMPNAKTSAICYFYLHWQIIYLSKNIFWASVGIMWYKTATREWYKDTWEEDERWYDVHTTFIPSRSLCFTEYAKKGSENWKATLHIYGESRPYLPDCTIFLSRQWQHGSLKIFLREMRQLGLTG
jgi:hypothetical protein